MACFTDLPYSDWSYQFLISLYNQYSETLSDPVSIGCYSEMNQSEKMYQFYEAFKLIIGSTDYLSQNCFVQLTEPQQWDALDSAWNTFV
jgi:hypothetical protein